MKVSLGNVRGFLTDLIAIMATVLGLGYMGGAIVSINSISSAEINKIFPIDITKAPYAGPPSPLTNVDGLRKYGISYMFFLDSIGFPYYYETPKQEGGAPEVINFLLLTCAHVFASWRQFYQKLIEYGTFINQCKIIDMRIGNYILFYIYPAIAIYMVCLPIIMVIMWFYCIGASIMLKEIPYPFIYTLSAISGPFYGLWLMEWTKPSTYFNMFGYGMIGGALAFVNIFWWLGIAGSVWIYSMIVLFCSPFFQKDGLEKVVGEITYHKQGLLLIFIYLTLQSAYTNLVPQAALGAMLCVIGLYLYQLYLCFYPKQSKRI